MTDDSKSRSGPFRSTGRYILIGLITAAPLAITWWIVHFLFNQLSALGKPWVYAASVAIRPRFPNLADFVLNETVQSVFAVLVVLIFLYILGWAAGRVIGQRLIAFFESVIGAIPFVDSIYRATKRFLAVAGSTEQNERRVVLIDFPSPEMKTIGLVTRIIQDSVSGKDLAAVYVPTSPNPTSGYIEIVPVEAIIFTDWTFDQAMSFVVTGGSNAPESITYSRPETSEPDRTA